MNDLIPLSVPNLKGNELAYVTDAIEKGWVSYGGAYVTRYETELANYLHVESACACQSGTAGLHLALILAGVEPEDEVIVPTLTFIASVNPVRYLQAHPVFMDCDDSLCMDMKKLSIFCETECERIGHKLINKSTRRQIKAVVVVHVFGNMADMTALMDIAEAYHLTVIEDASEALGTYDRKGRYEGRFAGTIGDIGVYSFNGNKIITTGGGGMLVSNDGSLIKRARYLSTQAKDDADAFLHHEVGYNYRMTNLQAALGVAQLEQLESFIAVKTENYVRYQTGINGKLSGLKILDFQYGIRPNYWFYSLYIDDPNKYTRQSILAHLAEHHIQARPVWGLIHTQKPYRNSQAYQIEKAYAYHQRTVNLPCSTNLSARDVHAVVDQLSAIS